jgi:chemotaxis protein MotB
MSTISEENFKALVMSFNPESLATITASPGGSGPNADYDDGEGGPMVSLIEDTNEAMDQEDIDQAMENLYEALMEMAQSDGLEDSISVTEGDGKVFVTFKDTTFFEGNKYDLLPESLPILDDLCTLLTQAAPAIDEVRILGHTAQGSPTQPNNVRTDRFLASNRATNVLVYIQEHSEVDAGRLVSEGMGQWRPVDTNDTSEGRANNRRVEMIISGRNLEEELGDSLQDYSSSTAAQ